MKNALLLIFALSVCFSVKSQSYYQTIAFPQASGVANMVRDGGLDTLMVSIRGQLYKYNKQIDSALHVNSSTTIINDLELFQGSVYIATHNGLISNTNGVENIFTIQNSPLQSDSITSVQSFQNKLYVGTSRGLYEYDGTNWQEYTTQNSPLLSNHVTAIAIGGLQGTIYIGTRLGLSIKSNQNWSSITTVNQPIAADSILTVVSNLSGVVWFATVDSNALVHLYRYRNQVVTDVADIHCDLYYYPIDRNCILAEFPNGDLMIRSYLNPYMLRIPAQGSSVNEKYLHYGSSVTLSRGGLIDNNNILWLSTSSKLVRYDLNNYPQTQIEDSLRALKGDYAELYINKVKAGITNLGDMHWDGKFAPKYEVPKGSCNNASFATGLWMGGIDNGGNLRIAAMTYRQNGIDFWPGPIDSSAFAYDITVGQQYNHIWNVDKGMIQDFLANYAAGNVTNNTYDIPEDILTWPGNGPAGYAQYLAPYYDVNNNGLYNPYEGDYPKITGDQMLFTMYNDLGGNHECGSPPMGIEIHQSAYAYSCDNIDPFSPAEALNYTTFYRYKIINRSTQNYSNFYTGLFVDGDLGYGSDDYIGCDTIRNTGYLYNGDNNDEGVYGYGLNPPMISYTILQGPIAPVNDSKDNDNDGVIDEIGEDCRLTNFSDMLYNGTSNPTPCSFYYNWLQTKYQNGTPVYNQLDSTIIKHLYPSEPYSNIGWNEQTDGNTPGYRRFIMASGPFNLEPGATEYLWYFVTYSRNDQLPNGAQTSIALHKSYIDQIIDWRYDSLGFPSCYVPTGVEQNTIVNAGISIYPNPTSGLLNIELNDIKGAKTVQVIDVTGRVVYTMPVNSKTLVFDTYSLPGGLYTIVVSTADEIITKRFVKE